MTPQERQTALRMAGWRGIKEGTPAWRQLSAWLDARPSHEFFLTTLRILRQLLDAETQSERIGHRPDLISFCVRIATASGGFLGVGNKVFEGEQAAQDQITYELNTGDPQATQNLVAAHRQGFSGNL